MQHHTYTNATLLHIFTCLDKRDELMNKRYKDLSMNIQCITWKKVECLFWYLCLYMIRCGTTCLQTWSVGWTVLCVHRQLEEFLKVWCSKSLSTKFFLVQVRLKTEALNTPSSTRPGFELMTSRSWQHISCYWEACSNHFVISDFASFVSWCVETQDKKAENTHTKKKTLCLLQLKSDFYCNEMIAPHPKRMWPYNRCWNLCNNVCSANSCHPENTMYWLAQLHCKWYERKNGINGSKLVMTLVTLIWKSKYNCVCL